MRVICVTLLILSSIVESQSGVICVTLLILSSFVESQSERFQVVGPEAALVAVAGEDLVLPCFLKPSTSAVDMTVEWMRLEERASLVHLYKDHKDRNEDQAQPYRGRTSLFKEELQKGNASLKLSALRVSDEGRYKCLIQDKSWYDDITVHIVVEERFQVVGPAAPLVAVAGEDLVLPCFLKPSTSAVDMTVEWLRLEERASLVHLYKDHKDRNEDQAQPYRGRTSLFKEELQKGNASLKLSPLRVSDEGRYKCLIQDKSWYDDITVHIVVEAQGSHPVIRMESYDHSGGINLVCESRGWKPEPEVVWLDREGVALPAEDTQTHRDTEGFSVKSRTTVYDYSDSNRYYCRLLQEHHMMETEVIINRKVFDAWRWVVGVSVSACLIAVGSIVTAVICYKKASELQKVKGFAELQRQRVEDEFIKKSLCAVDVTLDPDTAHPRLILYADGKQVRDGGKWQNLTDILQMFDRHLGVVGKQSFSSGRFYYEVQVRGKTVWRLGVVRENINRKGRITLKPQNGFWTVCGTVGLDDENQYWANADPPVPLTLREKLETVGVFVDYDEGLVSFYDVKSRSHIYSFTAQSFTQKLYPYFDPWFSYLGINTAPLIISPVFKPK
ncbi:butyrophilin subfamily 2 member A1-like isoform X2 [Neoarius graeffei]|uniref:butyrophilin subfamily 2 member A1-like isoform X2 n=1 Tax=Neoarius graeffei TaxID=443677 RepID=UPI00298D45EA|nr:butyrophilin subfamily 2 member A1-like isoform X2 [Neoarius graeffei]